MTPVDLPPLFAALSSRPIPIGGPEQLAVDALLRLFVIRGREALERYTRHGNDTDTEKLLTTACAAGLAFRRVLLASRPAAEREPVLEDLQLLMVELFERINDERAPVRRCLA